MQKVINIQQARKTKKDPLDFLSSNVLLLSFDVNFDVLSANETFLAVAGIEEKGLEELNFFEHLCSQLPAYIFDEVTYLLRQHKAWTGNFAFPNENGGPSWYHTSIIPTRDENGEFIGCNLIATVGKSEQNLISVQDTTASWMSAIFNDAEEANILIDLDGDVIEFNAKAYEFMEWYTNQELILKKTLENYFEDTFRNTFSALFTKAKSGQKQKFCRSFQNKSGYKKIVDIELKPVADPSGKIMGIILNSVDITEEVFLENRIRISEKKLDDIAFINAHEVRAPLASMMGLLHLLDFESVDDSSKVILNHLKKSSTELERIIHKISESSYLEDTVTKTDQGMSA